MDEKKQLTPEELKELLAVQQLEYVPPVDASIASTRTWKNYAFSSLSYPAGQNMMIVVGSGGDMINGRTSFLSFAVQVVTTGAGVGNWALNAPTPGGYPGGGSSINQSAGSAANIFQSIRLTHRNGDTISYCNNLNALIQAISPYDYGFQTGNFQEQWGGGSQSYNVDGIFPAAATTTIYYTIPLYILDPFFASVKLIPPQVIASLKIELLLAPVQTAIVFTGGGTISYSVMNPKLYLDSIDIYDSGKRMLAQQSTDIKGGGLQFQYYTWFNDRTSLSGTAYNFNIQKSASKTIKVVCLNRASADITGQGADSCCATTLTTYNNTRFRIGDVYIYQDLISDTQNTGATINYNSPTLYNMTMQAFGNTSYTGQSYCQDTDGIVHQEIMKSGPVFPYSGYDNASPFAIVAVPLERSTVIGLSGSPTNNSRLINFQSDVVQSNTANPFPVGGQTLDVWLQYSVCLNAMSDNVVLDI